MNDFSKMFDTCKPFYSFTELHINLSLLQNINPPAFVFEENAKHKKKPGSVRVDKMFEQIIPKFRKDPPRFLLCFLPAKFSNLYGCRNLSSQIYYYHLIGICAAYYGLLS